MVWDSKLYENKNFLSTSKRCINIISNKEREGINTGQAS